MKKINIATDVPCLVHTYDNEINDKHEDDIFEGRVYRRKTYTEIVLFFYLKGMSLPFRPWDNKYMTLDQFIDTLSEEDRKALDIFTETKVSNIPSRRNKDLEVAILYFN